MTWLLTSWVLDNKQMNESIVDVFIAIVLFPDLWLAKSEETAVLSVPGGECQDLATKPYSCPRSSRRTRNTGRIRMSSNVTVCSIAPDLVEEVKKLRFRSSASGTAIIMKVTRSVNIITYSRQPVSSSGDPLCKIRTCLIFAKLHDTTIWIVQPLTYA